MPLSIPLVESVTSPRASRFHLTYPPAARYRIAMPHSFLIFDFGKDEEAAQQARHKVEGWKQGFRLGDKILIKFERDESESSAGDATNEDGTENAASPKKSGAGSHSGEKKARSSAKGEKENESGSDSTVRLLVRLDFSDHEKLSLQRWLDRIPTEVPFKSAEVEIIRPGDPAFGKTTEVFDSLS